ncbi:hypothetical protein [Nonomuraea typhae]|uniref:hypothetical protein n=1 Tax=Nonomuraea typhae TaxID=2603600 RepID=UPI0012F74AEB|nr:hypothetical protein [Nonomuraea typhae]
MAGELAMTAKRWDELTALLQDEQLLQAEYPKVAEYLSRCGAPSWSTSDRRPPANPVER